MTGSNPLAACISDEPYWGDLADLLSWGREHVPSMLLSCLSAHAALVVFDGIERTTLDAKCTGVFPQRAIAPSARRRPRSALVLPHSRLNTVELGRCADAGYGVALESDAVGWSIITKSVGGCEVVLVQGHPEYDPSSLLREYHRDARRYVLGERDDVPCLPLHCVAPADWERLPRFTSGSPGVSGIRRSSSPFPSRRWGRGPGGPGGPRPSGCTPTGWPDSRPKRSG